MKHLIKLVVLAVILTTQVQAFDRMDDVKAEDFQIFCTGWSEKGHFLLVKSTTSPTKKPALLIQEFRGVDRDPTVIKNFGSLTAVSFSQSPAEVVFANAKIEIPINDAPYEKISLTIQNGIRGFMQGIKPAILTYENDGSGFGPGEPVKFEWQLNCLAAPAAVTFLK